MSNFIGGIVFGASTGTGRSYRTNSTDLFWDNTNLRLGVGTNSPASLVHLLTTGDSVVGLTIQALNATQSGDLLRIQNSAGSNIIKVSSTGQSTFLGTIIVSGGLAARALAIPSAPTVSTHGTTGSTTYGYKVSALSATGETLPSSETQITNGNATLNGSNYNTISWNVVLGASSYNVYRTTSGGTPSTTGLIGNVTASAALTLNDTGLAAGVSPMAYDSSLASTAQMIKGGFFVTVLPTPTAPTVAAQGTTGSTTYGYKITAMSVTGEGLPSSETQITNGNATLNGTNYNNITWSFVTGARSYNIYRTTSGGTPASTGLIGTVTATATRSFNDTGIAASSAPPTVDTSIRSGINTISPIANLDVVAQDPGQIALVVRGAGGQSQNIQQWTDVNGNRLSAVSNTGAGYFPGLWTYGIATKTAAYTFTDSDSVILVDASSAAVTIDLPDVAGFNGRRFTVKKIDSSANTVTLSSTVNIDGATTNVISAQYAAVSVISDGTQWWVI